MKQDKGEHWTRSDKPKPGQRSAFLVPEAQWHLGCPKCTAVYCLCGPWVGVVETDSSLITDIWRLPPHSVEF